MIPTQSHIRLSSFILSFGIDHELFGLTSNYAVLLLVSYLIFSSLKSSSFFTGINASQEKKPNLSDDVCLDSKQITYIEQYMFAEKPFLNHLLNIENLSNQLELPQRKLSLIINRHYQQNFFEFINNYRVNESKRLLTDPLLKKATMIEIMDKSGFNSKATFNVFFKKVVGLTPTQYRKENSDLE